MSDPRDLAAKSANRLTGFGRTSPADTLAPRTARRSDPLALFSEATPSGVFGKRTAAPAAPPAVNPSGRSLLDAMTMRSQKAEADVAHATALRRCLPEIRQSRKSADLAADALLAWDAVRRMNVSARGACSIQRADLADRVGVSPERAERLVAFLETEGLVRVHTNYAAPRFEAVVA